MSKLVDPYMPCALAHVWLFKTFQELSYGHVLCSPTLNFLVSLVSVVKMKLHSKADCHHTLSLILRG